MAAVPQRQEVALRLAGGVAFHQQVAVERGIHVALEAATFGVDFQQAVNGLGLKAGAF